MPATTTRKRKPDHEPAQAPAGQADAPAPDQAPAAPVPAPAQPQAAAVTPAAGELTDREAEAERIILALSAPFAAAEIKFKPQAVSGSRALAVPFVDARVVQDRLDDALGLLNWQDSYECLPDGSVVCRLKIRLCGEWITKEDVGGQSEQPDEGDRRKAAFSDALKRAAVKFGIGRYLYRQNLQWIDYDPAKRKWTGALPTLVAGAGHQPAAAPAAKKPAAAAAQSASTRADFVGGLEAYDKALAAKGLCGAGDLVKHVAAEGKKAGHPADLAAWDEGQVKAARGWTKEYARVRHQETLDDLLTAKGETVERALKALRKPPGSSIVRLTNDELWELIVRLRKVPDKGEAAA